MKLDFVDDLMSIPSDAINTKVLGVEMQLITPEEADAIVKTDPTEKRFQQCFLQNGRFLFESDNGELKSLYKVQN